MKEFENGMSKEQIKKFESMCRDTTRSWRNSKLRVEKDFKLKVFGLYARMVRGEVVVNEEGTALEERK